MLSSDKVWHAALVYFLLLGHFMSKDWCELLWKIYMSPCHFCCRVSMTCVCGQPFDANDGAIGQDFLFDCVAMIFISCKLGWSNLVTSRIRILPPCQPQSPQSRSQWRRSRKPRWRRRSRRPRLRQRRSMVHMAASARAFIATAAMSLGAPGALNAPTGARGHAGHVAGWRSEPELPGLLSGTPLSCSVYRLRDALKSSWLCECIWDLLLSFCCRVHDRDLGWMQSSLTSLCSLPYWSRQVCHTYVYGLICLPMMEVNISRWLLFIRQDLWKEDPSGIVFQARSRNA